MKKLFIIALVAMLLVVGCTPKGQESEDANPDNIITQYAEAIAEKDASTIVQLYGGGYEFMERFSDEEHRDDKEKVVANYMKLIPDKISFNEIQNKNVISEDEIEYEITFKNQDGSIFEVRDADTKFSVFSYIVKEIDGKFKVMNVPPYQP